LIRILTFVFLISGIAFGQTVNDCMDCHDDKELTKEINDSTEVSLFVDLKSYQKSIHGDMDCIDCHSTIEDADHEEDLPEVNCADCHDDAQEEFSESIHAIARPVEGINIANCKNCHGTHYILASDNLESKSFKLNIEKMCGECHEKPEVIKLLGLRGKGPVAAYHNSIHDKILHENSEKIAPTCSDCHGYHDVYIMSDPRSKFNKLNRPETCGKKADET